MRHYESGATRDSNDHKLQYAGFLSSTAVRAFAEYMHEHRLQADGQMRGADNWKKGIPVDDYMDSMWRHFWDVWNLWETGKDITPEGVSLKEALCALMFNVQGMLHEEVNKPERDYAAEINTAISELKAAVRGDFDWTPEENDAERDCR